jgi:outer membrane protein
MKRSVALLVVGLLMVFGTIPVYAQQSGNGSLDVGYVNLNRVLEAFEPYQEAMNDLEQFRSDIQEEIDQDRQSIGELRQQLQDSQYLSQEQRRQKQQQLRQRMQSYQQSRRRSQQMMQRRERQLLSPVRDSVQEAVKITGEDLDYDVIHRFGGRQPSTVMWVSPDVDITDQVIDRLDEVKPVEPDTSSVEEETPSVPAAN